MSLGSYTAFQPCNSHYDLDGYPGYVPGIDSNVNVFFPGQLRDSQSSAMDHSPHETKPRLYRTSTFPDVVDQTMHPYPEYLEDRRRSSPVSNGSHRSSYISSGWSDRQESPHSPHMITDFHPSPHTYNDGVPYAYGGHSPSEHYAARTLDVCNMQEIQPCPDHVSEITFGAVESMHFGFYGACAQEGYQPLQEIDECASDMSCCATACDYQPPQTTQVQEADSPVIRRRRQSRSGPSPTAGNRVSKRSQHGRHTSLNSLTTADDTNTGYSIIPSSRPFPCPLAIYGCSSSFGSKNEWKRHVNTQHMRLDFWRCDQCTTNANGDRKLNDFNRKDLFIQHVRRMHTTEAPRSNNHKRSGSKSPRGSGDDSALQKAAARCYKALRPSPKDSGCLFCDQEFHGPDSWDTRMEHIGRHMETTRKENKEPEHPRDWRVDELAQAWMASEQIIVPHGNKRWTLAQP